MVKNQTKCYRNIGGVKYMNYADLIYGDAENNQIIQEVKASGKKYKIVTHWTKEYKQIFVEADEN
jgi:hypothetical protein